MTKDDDALEPDMIVIPKTRGRPWVKGQSGNPGGKRRVAADVVSRIRSMSDDAVDRLFNMLDHPDWEARKFAIEYILRWGLGAPRAPPETEAEALPTTPEERLKSLEDLLLRFALDGDNAALRLALAGLAPEKYGRQQGEVEPAEKPAPTKVNFVGRGEARPGHGLGSERDE